MKKSQLKNIIRESIKEVMNEQTWQGLPSGPNWQTLQQNWSGNTPPPPPPQAFINRMTTMGCSGKQQRMNVLQQRINSLGQGINPTTGVQGPTNPNPAAGGTPWGSNPAWQSQLVSKIVWLYNDMQANNC